MSDRLLPPHVLHDSFLIPTEPIHIRPQTHSTVCSHKKTALEQTICATQTSLLQTRYREEVPDWHFAEQEFAYKEDELDKIAREREERIRRGEEKADALEHEDKGWKEKIRQRHKDDRQYAVSDFREAPMKDWDAGKAKAVVHTHIDEETGLTVVDADGQAEDVKFDTEAYRGEEEDWRFDDQTYKTYGDEVQTDPNRAVDEAADHEWDERLKERVEAKEQLAESGEKVQRVSLRKNFTQVPISSTPTVTSHARSTSIKFSIYTI